MQKTQAIPGNDYMFGKGQALFILVIGCLLGMVNYMDRQVFAVVQESIRLELQLTDTQIGLIQTCFAIGMGLFALPLSYAIDNWSRKKAMGTLAIIWSGFTLLTGLGRNFTSIFIPRTMVGIGEAGYTAGGIPLICAAYPGRLRATVMGIFNLVVIPIGSAVGLVLGGYLAVKSGNWRMPFYVFAIIGLVLGVMAFFLKDYKSKSNTAKDGVKRDSFIKSTVYLLKIPTLRWLYIGYAMMQIMAMSLLVWMPTFVIRAQGVKADVAGSMMGLIALLGIVGALLGGIIADKWQIKNLKARMLVPAFAVLAATVFSMIGIMLNMAGIGYVAACLYGVGIMMTAPLNAVTQDVAVVSKRGQAWGLNSFVQYLLGGGWAPVVAGALSDALGAGARGLQQALLITASFGFLSMFCYFMGARHYPSDARRAQQLQAEISS